MRYLDLINTYNGNYKIILQGAKAVIGFNEKNELTPYVTWDYEILDNKKPSYFWGHYTKTYGAAALRFIKKEHDFY